MIKYLALLQFGDEIRDTDGLRVCVLDAGVPVDVVLPGVPGPGYTRQSAVDTSGTISRHVQIRTTAIFIKYIQSIMYNQFLVVKEYNIYQILHL